jgi:tetratricopeptide (TPR) repeat protein
MQTSVTKDQIIDFIFNANSEEQRNKIMEAINTDAVTKEMYLFEKRKYDVEKYLDEEMSIGERFEIEELIKINPRLFEYFELSKDVNEFMQIEAFKAQLKNIHAELFNPDHNNEPEKIDDKISLVKDITPVRKLKHNVLRIGKWVAAASIIITIVLSGGNIYLNNRDSLENRLYAKYHEPLFDGYKNFFTSSSLTEAKNKYYNKEYDVALMLIENLPNSMTIESEKLLYRGLIFMELERFEEAIDDFEQIINNNNYKAIKSVVNWHLALCYLKIAKQEKAKELLEKIVQRNDSQYKEAKRILKKLNK